MRGTKERNAPYQPIALLDRIAEQESNVERLEETLESAKAGWGEKSEWALYYEEVVSYEKAILALLLVRQIAKAPAVNKVR